MRRKRERRGVGLDFGNIQVGYLIARVDCALIDRGEGWDGDVHIGLGFFGIYADDAYGRGLYVFGLDGDAFQLFQIGDELHKLFRADDVHALFIAAIHARFAGEHQPQAAPDCLLRQDVGFGCVGAQSQHDGYIADVPAFAQHHHADHGVDAAVGAVDVFDHRAGALQVGRGHFAVVSDVNDLEFIAAELVGVGLAQVFAHGVGVSGIFHHGEQDGLFAERLKSIAVLSPAVDRRDDVGFVAHGGIAGRRFPDAVNFASDGLLDDAVLNGALERVIADDPREERSVGIEAGRCGEVQLRHKQRAANSVAQTADCVIPFRVLVVGVMRFVVDYHAGGTPPLDAVVEVVALFGGVGCGAAQEPGDSGGTAARRAPTAFLRGVVELLNVGEIQCAARGYIGAIAAHEEAHIAPIDGELRRQHRILAKDSAAREIALQSLEHDDVGRYDEKVDGVLGALGFAKGVEVAPNYAQRHHHRLAAAGRHLDAVAREIAMLQ